MVDLKDWDIVKHVRWLEKEGCIQAENGTLYEKFIGIDKPVKNLFGNLYDKRREFFVGIDEHWVFSEYTGKYELLPPEKSD